MHPTPLRLALWQGPSPDGDTDRALATLGAALQAAAALGATMLTGPEAYLPGYNHPDLAGLAQPRSGPWHQSLAALCRTTGCGLTLGYAERDGDRLYNAAVSFDATGAEIAHYRKIQLYGAREQALYHPGESYCVFDLAGTRTALLICYDIEFAPHVAALAAQGVTLILTPTANMLPFTHVARVTVPAMSANHALGIAYANYCGAEGELTYCGGSILTAANGDTLALAGTTPTLLVADLATPDPATLSTQARDLRTII